MDSQMQLWSSWKSNPTEDKTEDLLDMFEKDIKSIIYKFSNADVPDYIVEAEAVKNVIKGLDTFDPSKNTALRTHINNYLKKSNRFVYDTQNVAKIPESRILKIQKYNTAVDDLMGTLERIPSSLEIAEKLGWDIKEISRMRKSLRPGSIAENNNATKVKYNFVNDSALQYIYYSIPSRLKLFFEYLTGYAGQPLLNASEIKKKMHLTDKKYRAMRDELQKFLKKNRIQDLLE